MILFGASGHSKVVLDILISNGFSVDLIIDDDPQTKHLFGIAVSPNHISDFQQEALIAIGNNSDRKKIVEKYPFHYIRGIHADASVSKYAKVGSGTVIMAQAAVNPDAEIGMHCIINTGAVVEHDCKIADFVHISPNASLAGNVSVEEGVHIGIGASVIQGITIGKWATVGAGSVIIKNVPDYATVVGNPGIIIKNKI
ncbi:acetyltransferase [Kaistella sp. 97-N-M2]|uniref:acetyltransferase n=1 Tax=Kaistella sp. 97-N-M2 TaxID=2908645 RepID=UPI001F2A8C39|nr:acetyltransferase [Kaistella sp. 97-N-M2]UJF28817.1 acetyltransferase [Kaistella sp. 97-N-M2]